MCITALSAFPVTTCSRGKAVPILAFFYTFAQAEHVSTACAEAVPRVFARYCLALCSFMLRTRNCTVGSRVGSVRIRASIRWQACMTVV